MNITFQSSVLITSNFNRLKKFYSEVLNLEIDLDFGPCIIFKGGIAIWQLPPDHKIAKEQGRQYSPAGNKNFELCFETEDFDASVKELMEHAPELLHDAEEETWGQKAIRFYDPDKNLIEIGETIPCFVRRLHNEGMKIKEVADKTGVQIEVVKEILA